MIVPPLSMWLDVQPRGQNRIRMWLPLFLLWLLLLPLIVLAFVVTMVVDVALILANQRYHHYTLLLYRCFEVLADTRGTVVRVNAENAVVDVTIF